VSVRWISAVWTHSPYRGENLLLHLALADFANDEGTCFPSVPTLARKARCSEVWARRCVRRMIDDGLLEIVEQGLGRGNVNRYRLLPLVDKTESELGYSEKGVTTQRERGNSDASLSYIGNRHEPSHVASLFARFWEAYPRKVSKGTASKAFSRVMARADAPTIDVLLSAVSRYAASVSDPRYVAHPATWLNGERWNDEVGGNAPASAIVRVPEEIRAAQSLGAAFALTGRTHSELAETMSTKSEAAQTAALEAFTFQLNQRGGK
jgi:hypothetical protein